LYRAEPAAEIITVGEIDKGGHRLGRLILKDK
jgi:hypothetical protein